MDGGLVHLKFYQDKIMKIKFKLQKNKGLTLIEILVYTAIFIMVVGSIALFASNLQSSRIRAQIILEVNDQGTSIVRSITQAIRNGSAINSPTTGSSDASLSIANIDPAINPIIFSQIGDVLYVTEGVASPVALSNNKVKVSNLVFNNLSRSSTPGIVQFRFTLENTDSATRAEEQYSVDFYGSASIR